MKRRRAELMNKIEEVKASIESLVNENKIDEAEALTAELDEAENELKNLDKRDALLNKAKRENPRTVTVENNEQNDFINYVRTGHMVNGIMRESVGEDGGYTVPKDVQTAINQYREETATLRNYVTVEPVTTLEGSRVFKSRRTTRSGMGKIMENGKIKGGNTMKFETVGYKVEKYGAWYPVTDELLADSDANIEAELVKWIGDEATDTDNGLILEQLKQIGKGGKTTVNCVDDFKTIFNVKLGQALRKDACIITNDEGFNELDQLKDSDGKYLLQEDPTQATTKRLFGLYPVVVIPSIFLPCDVTEAGKMKIPFYCGNFKEGIVLFDRQTTEIKSTTQGSVEGYNAFEQGGLLVKCTIREQAKVRDAKAIVPCEWVKDDASVEGE